MPLARPIAERFHEKYTPVPFAGCWIWDGAVTARGYGNIDIDGKMKYAHRVSWELHKGPIPAGEGHHGICVLHKCDVRSCVNPDHLFLGTHRVNMVDRDTKGRGGADRITEDQAREILASNDSQAALARRFAVTPSQISRIKGGRRWARLAKEHEYAI